MAVNECPKISDVWSGNLADTARVLGIHRNTLRRFAKLGRKNGGIDGRMNRGGRWRFTGKEIKRFWVDRL